MVELLLIVRLAGRRVALPAADVEAVVELEGLPPVPGTAPHVAGLSALRSRGLTVIDRWSALGVEDDAGIGTIEAIVVPSGGHTYALLVEQVEDVVESKGPPIPFKASPGAGWSRVSSGMVEGGDDLLLLVDPHALIAGPPLEEAA